MKEWSVRWYDKQLEWTDDVCEKFFCYARDLVEVLCDENLKESVINKFDGDKDEIKKEIEQALDNLEHIFLDMEKSFYKDGKLVANQVEAAEVYIEDYFERFETSVDTLLNYFSVEEQEKILSKIPEYLEWIPKKPTKLAQDVKRFL